MAHLAKQGLASFQEKANVYPVSCDPTSRVESEGDDIGDTDESTREGEKVVVVVVMMMKREALQMHHLRCVWLEGTNPADSTTHQCKVRQLMTRSIGNQ